MVAGQVTPDTFIVDKVNHAILETKIGSKELTNLINPRGRYDENLTRQIKIGPVSRQNKC